MIVSSVRWGGHSGSVASCTTPIAHALEVELLGELQARVFGA